ncbi:MAG: hypothetical protein HQK89_08645, partial [Nitrospirae bacterium]|nr:hypothetical protein [Nitrospirota bacterium]
REYYDITRGKSDRNGKDLVGELPNIFKTVERLIGLGVAKKDALLAIVSNMADFLRFSGITAEIKGHLSKAGLIAKEADDTTGEANCIYGLGYIHLRESRNDEAKAAYEGALALYRRVGHIMGEANCIAGFGWLAINEGRIDEGIGKADEAIGLYEKIKDRYNISYTYERLGNALSGKAGYEEAAKEYLRRAKEISESLPSSRSEG